MGVKSAGPRESIVFGLIFASIGIGVAGWGVQLWLVHRSTESWAPTPAKIADVEYKARPTKGGQRPRYRLTCSYAYEFEGKPYVSDRLRIPGGISGRSTGDARDLFERLRRHKETGKPFTVYVDPSDPATAILLRDAFAMYVLMLLGAIFIGIGGLVAWAGVADLREKRRSDAMPSDPGGG
jgi:hypothetical protein